MVKFSFQTNGHHWNIFVNPVGVDAIVQQTLTRCVAAGYVWNPYYTQLADPLNVILKKIFFLQCSLIEFYYFLDEII